MLKKIGKKLGKTLDWFERHESLVTAIINFITSLLLLFKALQS